jgi:hypothetical protein
MLLPFGICLSKLAKFTVRMSLGSSSDQRIKAGQHISSGMHTQCSLEEDANVFSVTLKVLPYFVS